MDGPLRDAQRLRNFQGLRTYQHFKSLDAEGRSSNLAKGFGARRRLFAGLIGWELRVRVALVVLMMAAADPAMAITLSEERTLPVAALAKQLLPDHAADIVDVGRPDPSTCGVGMPLQTVRAFHVCDLSNPRPWPMDLFTKPYAVGHDGLCATKMFSVGFDAGGAVSTVKSSERFGLGGQLQNESSALTQWRRLARAGCGSDSDVKSFLTAPNLDVAEAGLHYLSQIKRQLSGLDPITFNLKNDDVFQRTHEINFIKSLRPGYITSISFSPCDSNLSDSPNAGRKTLYCYYFQSLHAMDSENLTVAVTRAGPGGVVKGVSFVARPITF